MATIHFILQGKGGVGKSMIASFLYQALQHEGKEVFAFDTDPVNATLGGYKEFNVTKIDVLRQGQIDPRKFDELLEALDSLPKGAHAVVDSGASSFVGLGAYIKEVHMIEELEESGHTFFFHTVITGGQAILDTLSGLKALAEGFPTTPIAVWLNPYFGEIRLDGLGFEDFKIYQEFSTQFFAIVHIPEVNPATTGRDLLELFAKRQSFATGINSSQYIAVRSRLKRFWAQLLEAMKYAGIAG